MSKFKETPCEFYISKGECKKGRNAEHFGYCQICNKYSPRAKVKHINKKKEYLDKLKKNETY